MIFAIFWLSSVVFTNRTARFQSMGSWLLQSLIVAFGFFLIFRWGEIDFGPLNGRAVPNSAAVSFLGVGITVAGFCFALWARFFLGRNFSGIVTIKEGHTLVRSGPYRFVRHPIYTGLLLASLGTSMAFGYLRCFLGTIVVAIGFRVKSQLEERFMTEQFGAEYAGYKRQVKALIPFVW